jgi:HEAT repeat protein
MRGARNFGTAPARDIERHISHLNSADQQHRLAAIYTLGAMGEAALAPLLSSLKEYEGQNRMVPATYRRNADGTFEKLGDPSERRWLDGAHVVQDETYALSCLGEIAIDPLIQLLDSEDPWIVINAAFALGEIGSPAARAVPKMAAILDTSDDRIIRAVLEAIGCLGSNIIAALPAITKLLRMPRESWNAELGHMVHRNAINALLLSDVDIDGMEDLLVELLTKPSTESEVPTVALEILIRHGSPRGMHHAIGYLQTHRWDDSRWPEAINDA